MDPQAAAYPRGADQLLHEFPLLRFQLGKLIGNDQQMGHGLANRPLPVQPLVLVNIHGTLAGDFFRLIENLLPAFGLAVDCHHGTLDRRAVQIGDGTGQMRQPDAGLRIFERAGKPSPFIVDKEEGYLVRMKIHSQRQNISHEEFGFARAGGARHKAVGAMNLLMQIQHKGLAVQVHAYRRL